jgi:hypothetical protein
MKTLEFSESVFVVSAGTGLGFVCYKFISCMNIKQIRFCWTISELHTFPHQLKLFSSSVSFWVELVSVCNSIWYQSQRSRVRVLAGALIKIITVHSNIHVCGLGEPAREGKSWSISELSTFPHQLKLLG